MHCCDMSPSDHPDTPLCTDPTQHTCDAFVGTDPSTWRWCGQPAVAMKRVRVLMGIRDGEEWHSEPAAYYCKDHRGEAVS